MSSIGGGATAERNGRAGDGVPGQSLTPRTRAEINRLVRILTPSEVKRRNLRVAFAGLCAIAIEEATEHMMRELKR